MRQLIAASLLAAIGLASTQAQAALAPREAFNQACKSIKGQAPDSGPQVVQAKPAVKAIMGVLGGTNCDEMTKSAAALTELDVSGKEIVDISVTAFMVNLTTLNISNNKVKDIAAVSSLTKLTKLNAAQNEISDITAVSGLAALQTLNLSKNQVTDIGAIKDLPALTTLRADNNQVSKAFAVSNVKTLTSVNLNNNKIDNLSPLAKNKKLKDLKVKGNPVKTCPDGKKVEIKGKEIENTDLLRGVCKDEAYK
jgi:Leucine-rich repeat (LRR) protein